MKNTIRGGAPQSRFRRKFAFWGWLVALATGCSRQASREHAASSASPAALTLPHSPALLLSPSRIDVGSLLPNQSVERTIELANTSATVVHFRESASSSRCQWLQPLTNLPAGAKLSRTVRCQSDLQGPLKEQLTLADERPSVSPIVLAITGTVVPLLAFDPSFIDLRPEFGQAAHADVSVVGAKVKDARLILEPAAPSVVSTTALPANNGEPPKFRLTCRANRVGMHAGSLIARTGLPEPAQISMSWGCRVPATLEVNPSNPYFNLKVSGEKSVALQVKSRQTGFEIRSVRVQDGPFIVSLQPRNADGSYQVVINVLNDAIPDAARSASGVLAIESNDVREPHKEVPLFGFGQINKTEHR